jgi:prenyltransferase beta subunit
LTVPDLRNNHVISWLENEWLKDLDSATNLNYKGAWYLLVYCKLYKDYSLSSVLFNRTVDYLVNEQREDGGWGPWKNHPAPTDSFITGITSAALADACVINRTQQIEGVFYKSIKWFQNNQLENGLFPTHYIEEGSAWCYLGWNKAYNCLL